MAWEARTHACMHAQFQRDKILSLTWLKMVGQHQIMDHPKGGCVGQEAMFWTESMAVDGAGVA